MSAGVGSQSLDILDLVQESVVVFTTDGRITAWNSAAERLYGWKRHEVIGEDLKTTVQCYPSKMPEFLERELPRIERWEGELTRQTKSGERVTVKSTWSLRRDSNGRPYDVVDTSVDITAERRMEEALRRAEYRYYNLFQAMAASFWELDFSAVGEMVQNLLQSGVTDLPGYFAAHPGFVRSMIRATRVLDVNEQTVALFGSRKEDLLGNLERFWPEESTSVFGDAVLAAVSGRSHYAKEAKFRALDGREYDTLFTACFPEEMVRRGKLLIGIIDISAAKQAKSALEISERRYRNLFQLMPIALWQIDVSELTSLLQELRAAGLSDLSPYIDQHPNFLRCMMESARVIEVNEHCVSLVGANGASDLRGRSVTRFWSESPEIFRQALEASYRGETHYEAQIRFRRLDGRLIDTIFVAAFSAHLQDSSVSLIGMIDISDRVKAQEMLTHVQAEFAHAARVSMLGELTASIAHEVNQPLAAIITNGEATLRWLSREDPNIDEVRGLANNSVADARRAAEIIRRVRDMATHAVPETKQISINRVVRESLSFLGNELSRQNIALSLNLTPGLPRLVGDKVQLQQVLVNIVVNAMQAMAQNDVTQRKLRVKTELVNEEMIAVTIEDTGPGIREDDLGRLFESFFTTKPNGMGIGLPICRSIIEAHGGEITAGNSATEHGALVKFLLPHV